MRLVALLAAVMLAGCSLLVVDSEAIEGLKAEKRTVDQADGGGCVGDRDCTLANICRIGKTKCTDGVETCEESGQKPELTSCGASQYCIAGDCVGCGSACTPPNACKAGTLDCGGPTPFCMELGNRPEGTACGTNSYCFGGACSACGSTCKPPTPCHTGTLICGGGVTFCQDIGNAADWEDCGTLQVCQAGQCLAGPYTLNVTGGYSATPNSSPSTDVQVEVKKGVIALHNARITVSTTSSGFASNEEFRAVSGTVTIPKEKIRVGRQYNISYSYSLASAPGSTGSLFIFASPPSSGLLYPLVNEQHLDGNALSTFGPFARVGPIFAIVSDGSEQFFSEPGRNVVRKVSYTGAVTDAGGDGTPGYADGTNAKFSNPAGLAIRYDGGTGARYLYVADTGNQVIRSARIDLAPPYNWSTLASGVGAATKLSVVGSTLYIGSGGPELRRIDLSAGTPVVEVQSFNDPTCSSTTYARFVGCGGSEGCTVALGDGGASTRYLAGQFCGGSFGSSAVWGIAHFDSSVATPYLSYKAGGGTSTDDFEVATNIRFDSAPLIARDLSSTLLWFTNAKSPTDAGDHRIRFIDWSDSKVQTYLGTKDSGYLGDFSFVTGDPTFSQYNSPSIFFDSTGLFIADRGNFAVRFLVP